MIKWSHMSKITMLERGRALCQRFCEVNHIVPPKFEMSLGAHEYHGTLAGQWQFKNRGGFRTRKVVIYLATCRSPDDENWPAWLVDDTPYGVIAHELGHHFDVTKTSHRGMTIGDLTPFSLACRRASMEEPISPYHPDVDEWFAEIFRLFVTNHELLRVARPRAYEFIREHCEPVSGGALEELGDAPQEMISAAREHIRSTRVLT